MRDIEIGQRRPAPGAWEERFSLRDSGVPVRDLLARFAGVAAALDRAATRRHPMG